MMTKLGMLVLMAFVLVGCEFDTITNEETVIMAKRDAGAVKTGWQTSGTLQTNVTDSPVTLQANFVELPGEYTVQFGITNPPLDPATGLPVPFNPTALIIWSVEGSDVTRKVSVGNGVSVSGTAQAVKVIINDESVVLDPISGDPIIADYIVTAQVSKGGRPAKNQPPTLVAFQQVQFCPPTLNIPIPPGAISVSVSMYPTIPPDSTLIPANASFVAIYAGPIVKAYDPYVEGSRFVALPGNATTVQIGDGRGARKQVQVTFGIDG